MPPAKLHSIYASSDVISASISSLFQELLKGGERGVFWDEDLNVNVDPLQGDVRSFWEAKWDLKVRFFPCFDVIFEELICGASPLQLKILRQLVELQLCHSAEIKKIIDRAWGVVHNKHKKTEMTAPRPPPTDPFSQENLHLVPVGQDCQRKRYWVIDGVCPIWFSFPVLALICLIMNRALCSRLTVPPVLTRFAPGISIDQPLENHVYVPRLVFIER